MITKISEHTWYSKYEDEVLNHDKSVVLIFGAEWCGACHNLVANLEKAESNVDMFYLDVDKCDVLADDLGITNLPTVVIYENCDVSNVFENNVSAQEIIEYINGMS